MSGTGNETLSDMTRSLAPVRSRRLGPVVAVVALVASACSVGGDDDAAVPAPPAPPNEQSVVDARPAGVDLPEVTPPDGPPTSACADLGRSPGPDEPPPGAVIVSIDQSLPDLVDDQPPATTYWLEAGTHSFDGEFGQIVPQDGDRFIGAPGAVIDGRGVQRYAFGGTASDVTVSYLTVRGFAPPHNEGVVNHDSGDRWTVEYSTIVDNGGAGLMMGSGNVYRGNCIARNGQYGINAFRCRSYEDSPRTCGGPILDIVLEGNEIDGNNVDDWETQRPGCGCTGGVKFWNVHGAEIIDNWIHHNRGAGLWADNNNAGFLVAGNLIEGNDNEALFFEAGYDALIVGNTIIGNALAKGRRFADRGENFPIGAIYISEAGSDGRLDPTYFPFRVSANRLVDNWGGVVLWENADRYCASPANTHGSYCTELLDPYDPTACSEDEIAKLADVWQCRWRTQNVEVSDNELVIDKDLIGCAGDRRCGVNAIISNFGSFPGWSPFKGEVIQEAIVFEQGNRFVGNRYVGDWSFAVGEPGGWIDWDDWQAAPYGQDAGSTLDP